MSDFTSDSTSQVFPSANEAETGRFTKEQIDHLLKTLKTNSSSGIPNVSLAQIDSESSAISCHLKYGPVPWIIDFGASDHMTNFSNSFSSYSLCSGNEKKIRIADGSFSPIAGKGLIKLSEKIDLKSVLHVPKLACNLLSVSKLSRDSNCRVIFLDSQM